MSDILYEHNPSMFRNHPFWFVICCILCLVAIGIPILMWWYLKTKSTLVQVTADEFMVERGILSKDSTVIRVSKIRTVSISQSFWGRVFKVGTVKIYTAGDLPEAEAEGMPDPHILKKLLTAEKKMYRESKYEYEEEYEEEEA